MKARFPPELMKMLHFGTFKLLDRDSTKEVFRQAVR